MNENPKVLLLIEGNDRLADALIKTLVPLHITVIRLSSWEAGLHAYQTMPKINMVASNQEIKDSQDRTGTDLLEMISPHIPRVLYSGTDEEVPEGVLFFNKKEMNHLVEYLDSVTVG